MPGGCLGFFVLDFLFITNQGDTLRARRTRTRATMMTTGGGGPQEWDEWDGNVHCLEGMEKGGNENGVDEEE